MRERIIKFIESEKLSAAEFADRIGVQRSSVSHVLNGRNNPGFSFIQKILEHFPGLDARWLLTGEGEMDKIKATPIAKARQADNLFSFNPPNENQTAQIQSEKESSEQNTASIHQQVQREKSQLTEKNNEKKVSRVLIFYDDHTFEDFRPAK